MLTCSGWLEPLSRHLPQVLLQAIATPRSPKTAEYDESKREESDIREPLQTNTVIDSDAIGKWKWWLVSARFIQDPR